MTDQINHPPHYTRSGLEPIDAIEAWFPGIDYHLANTVKYIARAGHKVEPGETPESMRLKDLRKAQWYLNRAIARLEKT